MQLFKLVIAAAFFGFLFQDRINAKEPLAMVSMAIIFAGFLIGGERTIVRIEGREEKTEDDE